MAIKKRPAKPRREAGHGSYLLRHTDEALWHAVKVKAVTTGHSVKAIIENLLRAWITE